MSSRLSVGARDDWQTPEVVLERVRRIGQIELDPCGAPGNPTDAQEQLHPQRLQARYRDGLTARWDELVAGEGGVVYVNCPYSQMKPWAAKVAAEAAAGCEIVSLVGARPDARWFDTMVWQTAQAVCFWRGRLRFVGAPSSAPFPSCLAYHGSRPWIFEGAFSDAGHVVRLR